MDSQIDPSLKVRLKTDLTHYHPDLTPGSEGYTIGVNGQCSRLSARYTGVWFPGIRILDVNCASLEIIDERYLARQAKERQAKRNPLKRAFRSLAAVMG